VAESVDDLGWTEGVEDLELGEYYEGEVARTRLGLVGHIDVIYCVSGSFVYGAG
jgi:hypothetical protein